MELQDLPNIGSNLAEKLKEIGINTPENLLNSNSKDVFVKLKIVDEGCCINMLYALEGAIRGIRWHSLDKSVKEDLKYFYDTITYNGNYNEEIK